MANPLPNEQEIYDKIKREKINIHPLIWELIRHHIGNDLYVINIILGSTVLDGEILTEDAAKKILRHSEQIQGFIDKLGEATTIKLKDAREEKR